MNGSADSSAHRTWDPGELVCGGQGREEPVLDERLPINARRNLVADGDGQIRVAGRYALADRGREPVEDPHLDVGMALVESCDDAR
jgi:hypothetical protein